MNEVRFTIIVHAHDTDPSLFRKMIESIKDINYKNFELIIIDSNQVTVLPSLIAEIMPGDGRVVYRKARLMNEAEAFNAGLRLMSGDYCLFLGQYDMPSPALFEEIERLCISSLLPEHKDIDFDTLTKAASGDRLRLWKRTAPGLIYTDYDEIIDDTRMNPHFYGAFSPELLCQSYYFNRAFVISLELLRRVGTFDINYTYGHIYDYLLRILDEWKKNKNSSESRIRIYHLPGLYYHLLKRTYNFSGLKKINKDKYTDLRRAALSYLRRNGIKRKLSNEPESEVWAYERENKEDNIRKNDYILMKDDDVRVNAFPKALADMYSFIREKDVAVVGGKFVNKGRIINCGFIYDDQGFIYPACSGYDAGDRGYENRISLTQDVSMVDPSFCLIDARIYRRLGGFNSGLLARDAMLDFCLRAISRGYRIVYDANVTARKNEIYNGSSESSHNKLLEYYGDNGTSMIRFSDGDRYYNPNLKMGVTNYYI